MAKATTKTDDGRELTDVTQPGDKVGDGDGGEREPTPNERASQSNVTNATVRPQQYADGEGFKAGQVAPSTKYIDRDRNKVSDKEPKDGGWVLVAEGSVVTPDQAALIAGS